MIAAVAYFSMGANLGWTGILVEFERSSPKVAGNIRQIFYVRYIDCKFCFPATWLRLGADACRVSHYAIVAARSPFDLRTTNTYHSLHNLDQ